MTEAGDTDMTTTAYAVQPTSDEVLDAFQAGYRSIDDGQGFYYGFENHLAGLGYAHIPGTTCTCPDFGRHGHMPECRWLRDWPQARTGASRARPGVHSHGEEEAGH